MSIDRFTTADGCSLAYEISGEGMPVLWQHGLGAGRKQPGEVFPEVDGFQRITFECRGHGESDLGDVTQLSIAQFADDALELLDHLKIDRFVVGGISLGAAISLRLATTAPDRARALILGRPAWTDHAAPSTMRPYLLVADLLGNFGPEEGLRRFDKSEVLAEVHGVSSDNAASLRTFFAGPQPERTIELLSRVPSDGPGVSAGDIAKIAISTLLIANGEDYVHPIRYAERLNYLVPRSTLQIITSKSVNKSLYVSEFRSALASFLETFKPGQ